MATIELRMPKMGESISEATILNWLVQVGDAVEIEETILEVGTDKVDSEVPSPCTGVITEILCQPNDVIAVGAVLALIESDGTIEATPNNNTKKSSAKPNTTAKNTESKKFQLKKNTRF